MGATLAGYLVAQLVPPGLPGNIGTKALLVAPGRGPLRCIPARVLGSAQSGSGLSGPPRPRAGGCFSSADHQVAGSLSFGLLEVFSRAVGEAAGPGNALFFATPLLALASVAATSVCATAVCPFEAVRILSVRSGESSSAVLKQQVEAEGVASLFRGLPALLLKEIPFVVTKSAPPALSRLTCPYPFLAYPPFSRPPQPTFAMTTCAQIRRL